MTTKARFHSQAPARFAVTHAHAARLATRDALALASDSVDAARMAYDRAVVRVLYAVGAMLALAAIGAAF
jgi:hypothetical protein